MFLHSCNEVIFQNESGGSTEIGDGRAARVDTRAYSRMGGKTRINFEI